MYVYVWIYISDSFVKSCHVVSTRSRKENACFLSRRNIHNFTCAICLSDFWNAAVKTCRPRDSFSKQQKKVPRCYSIVWTSEYQIHATVYLTTNSNQLKIDKKINAKNSQSVSAIQIDSISNKYFFIHIWSFNNKFFSLSSEREYTLIFVFYLSQKFLFHRLDHSS